MTPPRRLRKDRVTGLRPPLGRAGWALIGGALAVAAAVAALIDGGERPLRPIAEPVTLPGQP